MIRASMLRVGDKDFLIQSQANFVITDADVGAPIGPFTLPFGPEIVTEPHVAYEVRGLPKDRFLAVGTPVRTVTQDLGTSTKPEPREFLTTAWTLVRAADYRSISPELCRFMRQEFRSNSQCP
jgi:hypothetical protein